ncbi:DUF7344 domain-containing protein [Haladaptatus caseinilyticus]|uniref:DUF7344 domain-containing protein n=1 Tax=Haladaptatus caseinilyticus TaxID=2993314 RepID=UPI00224A73B6|nr:hypothetical protein [Haladaptatus caseinilyticus]
MGEDEPDDLYDILLDESIDDPIYRALANQRRRYVLYVLKERERITMDELADVLTGWIHAREYRMASSVDREQLATELREADIPALEDAGLARYDDRKAVLTLAELPPPVARLLDWAQRNDYENSPDPNTSW